MTCDVRAARCVGQGYQLLLSSLSLPPTRPRVNQDLWLSLNKTKLAVQKFCPNHSFTCDTDQTCCQLKVKLQYFPIYFLNNQALGLCCRTVTGAAVLWEETPCVVQTRSTAVLTSPSVISPPAPVLRSNSSVTPSLYFPQISFYEVIIIK